MVTDWSNGDDQGIAALMNDGLGDSPELERVMLTDRNARWAGWIAERLKQPGTVFVAVGAGHLAGENSVRADLAKHHLTETAIAHRSEEQQSELPTRMRNSSADFCLIKKNNNTHQKT